MMVLYFADSVLRVTVNDICAGLILGLRPANDRRRYKVTPSLIGWVQTWTQPSIRGVILFNTAPANTFIPERKKVITA